MLFYFILFLIIIFLLLLNHCLFLFFVFGQIVPVKLQVFLYWVGGAGSLSLLLDVYQFLHLSLSFAVCMVLHAIGLVFSLSHL